MKKTLFILLFALLFENVFLGPSPMAKRIARIGKIYREKKLRELQNSDESQAQDTDKGTEQQEGEHTTADAPAVIVDVSVPVSTKGYKKKKSSPSSSSSSTRPATSLKINKFYNYVAPPEQPKVIKYNTLFSFLNVIIAFTIRLRLRIAYSFGRLRNLQDDESAAESVPSTCYINNTELAGKNGTGANIKYDCNATTTYNATDITNVTINTDVPLQVDNKSYSFENVTFNGNSSEEASNLVSTEGVNIEGDPIEIRDADITVEEDKVVFTGTVAGDEGASTAKTMYDGKETFTMLLSDFSSGTELFEEYGCQISSYTADGDNGKVDMTCDTSSKTLKNPNAFNFDDSLSIGERVVTLHMKEGVSTPVNWEVVSTDTDTTTTTAKTTDAVNNISYRKNSSGLSGGAIAGIVIACAVVLIAASIVAMMLRKPAPPLDNTTVVGLKTVDNY